MEWIGCVHWEKFWRDFVYLTCAIMAPVRPVLHWVSCNNDTVRNAPEHEFLVKWSGSGAFVAKNSDTTLFSELVRWWHLFVQFCIDFRAVSKWSETAQNMSFGSYGMDRVRSLRKILTRPCLANLCVNGTSSASLHRLSCSNETVRNAPKHEFWVQ
jgi:hypothetical protein